MTLAERLAAIAEAPDGADLAELLGVEARELAIDGRGLTVGGESITLADARRALRADPGQTGQPGPVRSRFRIEDLDPCGTSGPR